MTHRDMDHLVSTLMPAAKAVLARERAMPPFGAELLTDGDVITRCSHGHGAEHGHAPSPGRSGGHRGHGAHGAPLAEPKPQPRQDPKKVVAGFEEEFRSKARAGEVRAVAICMSVTTNEGGKHARKTHAIRISVEHESGDAMDVYCPYRRGWFGRFRFGEPFSQRRPARIFKVAAPSIHSTDRRSNEGSRTLSALEHARHQRH